MVEELRVDCRQETEAENPDTKFNKQKHRKSGRNTKQTA